MLFVFLFFFVNDTATTEIYTYRHTLSLHDALPISPMSIGPTSGARPPRCWAARGLPATAAASKNSSMERPSTPPIPRHISPAWRSSGSDEQGQMSKESSMASPSPSKKDRKSVVSGKSVSVRVDLGGRGIHKKKKKKTN